VFLILGTVCYGMYNMLIIVK